MKVMSGENAEAKRLATVYRWIHPGWYNQVHNIELYPGKGGQLVRSAGNAAQLMAKGRQVCNPYVLPSGEMRMVPIICRATIGVVGQW